MTLKNGSTKSPGIPKTSRAPWSFKPCSNDMDLLAEQAEQLISDQLEIARRMRGSNLQSLTRLKN